MASYQETTANTQPMPTILFSDLTPPYSDQAWGFPSAAAQPPPTALNTPTRCSCLGELLQLAQQLEDDEFHVTSLPLDEVLHLKKGLISQCTQSIDCTSCLDPMAVHTVRLMVCEHLTEIFEGVYGRILSAGAVSAVHYLRPGTHQPIRSSVSVPSPTPTPSPPCLSPPSPPLMVPYRQNSPSLKVYSSTQHAPPTPPQMYYPSSNTTNINTGAIAALNNPNTFLLSASFRERYSPEEQIHVIRVLLRLQARDFRALLARLVEVYSWMDEDMVGGAEKNGRRGQAPATGTGRQGRGARLVARVRGMGERLRRAEEGVTGE
ncbi:uncharacterized protein C8A04DRAFT_15929 [Dichotomopilus funicola]|uniref:Uncharacterized protein n=1 Tax=Dichotomopilus funicola TaxID=1934379 RepID=A0AAN6UWY3_9PEZI|nr:hypothetical protein C8A04DRAFT_15929 [Dichotomopilus funicola]